MPIIYENRKIGNRIKRKHERSSSRIGIVKKFACGTTYFPVIQRYAPKVKAYTSIGNVKLVQPYDINRVFTDQKKQVLTDKMPQSWIPNQMADID